MTKKPKTIKPGVVQKIIEPRVPHEKEMAEIAIEGADHLYREIRIENKLQDPQGKPVALKDGAEVEITIAADPDATMVVMAADHVVVEPGDMLLLHTGFATEILPIIGARRPRNIIHPPAFALVLESSRRSPSAYPAATSASRMIT